MENSKVSILQKIEQAGPAQLAAIPEVADRFKQIYLVMQGGKTDQALAKYEAEKFHFMKTIQDNPKLQNCTKLSLYGCFLDVAVNGLSFDPGKKMVYIVPFNVKVSPKGQPDQWESRATLMVSGYGELHMRVSQGQIKYADNPVLVYQGDHFTHGTKDGKVFLEHLATFPRKSEEIIACYLRIERIDGSVDYKVLSIGEVMKFKAFSKDKESLAWNAGLPGMVQAKTIKHAFRSYPKMRKGEFSQLASETVEEEVQASQVIDYGLNGSTPSHNVPDHEEVRTEQVDDSFVAEKPAVKKTPVVHSDDNF